MKQPRVRDSLLKRSNLDTSHSFTGSKCFPSVTGAPAAIMFPSRGSVYADCEVAISCRAYGPSEVRTRTLSFAFRFTLKERKIHAGLLHSRKKRFRGAVTEAHFPHFPFFPPCQRISVDRSTRTTPPHPPTSSLINDFLKVKQLAPLGSNAAVG